jgi:hypothetical protein
MEPLGAASPGGGNSGGFQRLRFDGTFVEENMPRQAPLTLIKRCRLYERRGDWKPIPRVTRGLYVLYRARPGAHRHKKIFEVVYIGVGGVSRTAKSGVGGRIQGHDKTKHGWTHYSFFEVHDNISREEILELEGLLLRIFRHDPRVELANVQLGSKAFRALSKKAAWSS